MKKIIIPVLFAITSTLQAQNNDQNPLLLHNNQPIDFSKVNAATIKDAYEKVVKLSDEKIKTIVNTPTQNISNTLTAFDNLQYDLNDLSMKLNLISSTYADDSTRNAAYDVTEKLQLYLNNLILNEPLYKALKKFETAQGSTLVANQKKFLSESVIAFEKNGMKLNAAERKPLEEINKKITEFGNQFDKNINLSSDSVEFTEDDLKGVDKEALIAWKRPNGKYIVKVNGPNATTILENAEKNQTRKTFFLHYSNRAYPQNVKVLDSLFYYRNEYAKHLGFNSYAQYAVVDKMAGKPETVWAFENDLVKKITPLVTDEVKTLRAFKHELRPAETDSLFPWDFNYYSKQLLNKKYQLNKDEVKEYFEMNATLKGMFKVYESLLGIEIKTTNNMPSWDSKVQTYEIWSAGKKIGSFYLDLFPRANKYTHFACYPISQYMKNNTVEVLPQAALICNFPEGTANQPSLLPHASVITMFHEFGHLVHFLLCHPEIASQNSFAVKGDFTEAPSQFLENWCWEYDAIKLFAKNYKTGAPIPVELFNKMKQTKLVNVGSLYIIQVGYGLTDFTYEDHYSEAKKMGVLQVYKQNRLLTQLPFDDNSHAVCSFGHLNGYGANYYGYLWSLVYAQDMFSIFKKNGVMDTATGIKYRKEILEKGATEQEIEMVEKFLGRKPNSNAFLESLGIKN